MVGMGHMEESDRPRKFYVLTWMLITGCSLCNKLVNSLNSLN